MKLRMILLALILLAAGIGAGMSGVFSADPPEAQITDDYQCTTCDARQQAKKRLREKLKSASTADK